MQAAKIQFVLSLSFGGGDAAPDRSCGSVAWEDELKEYERNRLLQSQRDELATQRNRLLEGRHSREWMALRNAELANMQEVNASAGRDIFRSLTPRSIRLEIEREDREKLTAEYDEATKRVVFSSDTVLFTERAYELVVRPVNGNDALIWPKDRSKALGKPSRQHRRDSTRGHTRFPSRRHGVICPKLHPGTIAQKPQSGHKSSPKLNCRPREGRLFYLGLTILPIWA